MSITLRAKRILTGALAGALVLGLLPAGVASAATTACQGAASGTFTDSNPTHQANIDCIAAYNVVSGFANGTFGGSQNITRGQMATFIARFAATTLNVDITDIEVASHTFTDVAGNVHADNIARIFGLGVTAGRTATTFAPNDTITRAEAATMLANAHVALGVDLSGVTPSTAFTDLGTSVHATNINILAGAGVVSGKTATTFAPSASILRAEAATLLVRSITVLRSQNIWAAPPLVAPSTGLTISPAGAVTLTDETAGSTDEALFTVSGLVVGETYDVALVTNATANWQSGAVGERLALANGLRLNAALTLGTVADVGINQVNGVGIPATDTTSFTANATSFNFRVARLGATNQQDVYPVVTRRASGATPNVVAVNLAGVPQVDHVIGGLVSTRVYAAPDSPTELPADSESANIPLTSVVVGATAATSYEYDRAVTTLPVPALRVDTGVAITATGNAVWLRDNDVYRYQGAAITRSEFLGLYSPDDTVEITYNKGAATPSIFNIVTDAKPAAPAVTATVAGSSVEIEITPNARTVVGVSTYEVQRRAVTSANSAGAWTAVTTVVQAHATNATKVTDTPTAGDWEYRVRSVNPVSNVTSDWQQRGTADSVAASADFEAGAGGVTVTAKEAGNPGNAIRVTLAEAGNDTPLTVTVSGTHIIVNLATGATGAAASTAAEVVAAINGSTAASALVTATVKTADVVGAETGLLENGNSQALTTPATAAVADLAVLRTFLTTNVSPATTLSQGDVFKVVFNRPIAQPAVGSTIVYDQLTLSSATTAAGNATFTVNASPETIEGVSFEAGRVLTVTMTKTPTADSGLAGGDLVFGAGNLAEVTTATGFTAATLATGVANTWAGATVSAPNGSTALERDVQ